jgi:phosphoribosylformylglycinamidine (FGAM) synthase PurS component
VALLLEDEHVVAVRDNVRDPQAQQISEALLGLAFLCDELAGAVQERVHELVADLDEQLLLAAEVPRPLVVRVYGD